MASEPIKFDNQLWQDVLKGNAGAWATLVRRYQALIYTVAVRAGLSSADCADCFQQTWTALFENRHKITDPTRLPAWLVTTARREAVRLSRRSQEHARLEDAPEPEDSALRVDTELEALKRSAILRACLDSLDDRCRQLLTELFLADRETSYEQIAERLNIAFNSLGPVRGRCLEKLRKLVEGFDVPVRKLRNVAQ